MQQINSNVLKDKNLLYNPEVAHKRLKQLNKTEKDDTRLHIIDKNS